METISLISVEKSVLGRFILDPNAILCVWEFEVEKWRPKLIYFHTRKLTYYKPMLMTCSRSYYFESLKLLQHLKWKFKERKKNCPRRVLHLTMNEWMKITEYKDLYENCSENDKIFHSSNQYGSKGNGWFIS